MELAIRGYTVQPGVFGAFALGPLELFLSADKGLRAVPWLARDIRGRSCAMPKEKEAALSRSSQSLFAMPS